MISLRRLGLIAALAALPPGPCSGWTTSPPSMSAQAEPIRIRVLTYNIHHGEGEDRRLDLERIAGVILSVDPHLVALQEVDRNTRRSGAVDQPEELARLTGMQVVFGANIEFEGGQYGNAVLSRLSVLRHENHALPRFDGGEQRGVLEVEVEWAKNRGRVLFLATHLDHRSGDEERLASAKVINQLIAAQPGTAALLAGDLNDVPGSRTLMELEKHWTRPNEEPFPTIPVANPTRQIDYVLLAPAKKWRVVEIRVLDEAVASDHRAVFVVLELLRGD